MNQGQIGGIWQKVSYLFAPFFKQIAPIVVLHREMHNLSESSGLISNLMLAQVYL